MDVSGTADGVGLYSDFQYGTIFWHPDTDVHMVRAEILDKWNELEREIGPLGYPTSDESATADGIGHFNDFQYGTIYWSPESGAHAVHGEILGKWSELERETGPLGYPTLDEAPTEDGVGHFNDFQHGSIYWHPDLGMYAVYGDIFVKWYELGRETGPLGYPTMDISGTADGVGLHNDFQYGSIFSHPDIGTYAVHGKIYEKWYELEREIGPLGYPTSDEASTADGAAHFNDFQFGTIYSHPDIGTYAVYRQILEKWNELGRETSCLGYPVSDQEESSEDWVFQSRFERGIIKWSPEQGAVETCD